MIPEIYEGQLEEWLKRSPHNRVVGGTHGHRSQTCPIATYIKDLTGDYTWRVGQHSFFDVRVHNSSLHPLPVWATRFIKRVDEIFEDEVTAEKALAVLISTRKARRYEP